MHQARAEFPGSLVQLFGNVGRANRLLAADANTAQDPENRKLPDIGDKTAQEGEQRIAENGQHQRTDAADAVADRPPHHRRAPPEQEKGEQNAAVVANIARRCLYARPRQQLGQRRHEDERIYKGVHSIERPATPRRQEPALLIRGELETRLWNRCAGHHVEHPSGQ